jgi:hypothetical protein
MSHLFAFREVYAQGRREPFAAGALDPGCASLPASQSLSVAELEPILRGASALHMLRLQRGLAAGDWTSAAAGLWQKDDRIDLKDYCDHYTNRRPDLEKKYLSDINFYDGKDAIIRLVRSIQAGKPDATIPLDQAVQSARKGSLWAQTIATGYTGIVTAAGRQPNARSREEP